MDNSSRSDWYRALLGYQVYRFFLLIPAAIGVYAIGKFWPDFFKYPYLFSKMSWETLARFWPLFLYCLILGTAILMTKKRPNERFPFFLSSLTSLLAGVWEEIGFRGLFICYAMVVITWMNFLFSTLIGTIAGLALVIVPFFFWERRYIGQTIIAILVTLLGIGLLYFIWKIGFDPVFWLYRKVFVPFIELVTLGQFREIFHNGYPELFVFGMVASNAWFREGHEYQGLIGIVNSWVIGFVMMYAMLNYGLFTAVVLHVLYDLELDVLHVVLRR